jgi:hypothetical protein
MNPRPRPLPRSLIPLHDETIPGYLLRLAHRLDQSPATLARVTGLARASGLLPNKPLLRLDEATTQRFAFVCRLTEKETTALTLTSLGHRYIPLDLKFNNAKAYNWTGLRSAHGVPYARWILTRDARYCPGCLAGDNDPIQMLHGGAWKRTWRIPFVFACPDHQCLLSDQCPRCHNPLPGGTGLIHRPGEVLHPAQCRAADPDAEPDSRNSRPCCRYRLDSTPAQEIEPSLAQSLLELQRRILNILLDDTPEQPIVFGTRSDPARYLADLRVTMLLIQQTWPIVRDLERPARLTELMDHHIEAGTPRVRVLSTTAKEPMDRLLVDLPPAGVLTCAAVIAIADHLLCHPDHALAAGLAREMFLNVHATTSRHQISRHIPFGSPALKNALYGRAAALPGSPLPA